MEVQDKICQSCAMPLSADPKGGGTEADGSLSTEYCSYCYEGGQFHDPGITLPEFVAKLRIIMGNMNMPPEVAAGTEAILPTLKRWRDRAPI